MGNKLFDNIDSNRLQNRLAIILVVAVILIFIVFIFYFHRFSDWDFTTNNSKENWGAFGDFVGGTLNPLLSFLGLIALLFTIALQNKELTFSKSAYDKQQFESTFFALFEQHNKILAKLLDESPDSNDIPIYYDNERNLIEETPTENYIEALIAKIDVMSDINIRTHDVIIHFGCNYPQEYINTFGNKISGNNELNRLYKVNLFLKTRHPCGYYFRFLYQLLKFIATNIPESEISSFDEFKKGKQPSLAPNEKMYSNLVRSLLTNDIILLLAINCYCQDENDDFLEYKLLLERYAFFEHLPYEKYKFYSGTLISDIKKHYDKSAFGNNDFFRN